MYWRQLMCVSSQVLFYCWVEKIVALFEFLHKITEVGNIVNRDFTTWKLKKISSNKILPSEHWTWDRSHLNLILSSLSYWGMCYLGVLRSLYLHIIPTKWYKSKDIPSSTCLDSSERRALDLNDWDPRFNTHWIIILLLDFFCFHIVKPLYANIVIIANSVC